MAATSASEGRVPLKLLCMSFARACGTPVARSTAASSAAAPPARGTVTSGIVFAPCFSDKVSDISFSVPPTSKRLGTKKVRVTWRALFLKDELCLAYAANNIRRAQREIETSRNREVIAIQVTV